MRILLTGASGMVGRNILEHSAISNHEILSPTRRELNLLDSSSVDEYVKNNKPDMYPPLLIVSSVDNPVSPKTKKNPIEKLTRAAIISIAHASLSILFAVE